MNASDGLSATKVSKSFHGNRVLSDLDLTIPPGRLHALLGHNGSGKSTFIKILAGYYTPDSDSGPISVGGIPVKPGDPDSSQAAGITFVHQTLGLVPTLSVLENLRLGKSWRTGFMGKISWGTERKLARKSLSDFGLETDPDALVGDLSSVEQSEVAIVRALTESEGIRLLVLDEPTAALTDHEVNKLFETIQRIKAGGVAVLYVTHRLDEIGRIADDVTVLRDGRDVGHGSVSEFPRERLVELISGPADDSRGQMDAPASADAVELGNRVLLKVEHLQGGELLDGNFEGRGGEIVGLVGLLGSGIIDVARLLTGRIPAAGGQVELDGQVVELDDFADLCDRGLGAVVGERADRVAMSLSVRENLTLGILPSFMRGGFLSHRRERDTADAVIERFEVRCAGPEAETASLSGGNQQKAAMAKVLQMRPKVLLLEEPCHGVDARGREEIEGMLRSAASEGTLVLVIDSDLEEIIGLCSRVIVFRGGAPVAEFQQGEMTRSQLFDASYGSTN